MINGQTGGILLVLVFGAGTNYALLLTARYREELHRVEDKHEAMAIALAAPGRRSSRRRARSSLRFCASASRRSTPCQASAQSARWASPSPRRRCGPSFALCASGRPACVLAVRPALRRRYAGSRTGRVGKARARGRAAAPAVWVGSAAALAVLALGMFTLDDDLTTANFFRGTVEAVEGPAPARAIVRRRGERADGRARPGRAGSGAALEAARNAPGVASVGPVERRRAGARFDVTLTTDPFGERAFAAVEPLRERLRAAAGPGVLVGGPTAEKADLRSATDRDTRLLVPLVLLVVFAILVLLLRSLAAPAMLMGTVVLSFLAAIGGSLLLFEAFADFPGEDRATRSSRSSSSSRSASTTTSS